MEYLPLFLTILSVSIVLSVGSFYLGRWDRKRDTIPDNLPPEIETIFADHVHQFGRMGRDGKWRCYFCKEIKGEK